MHAWFIALCVWGLVALRAGAGDLPEVLVVQGREYRAVQYVSQDAAWLTFRHADGVGRVRLADLTEDLRIRLGYDAERAMDQMWWEWMRSEENRLKRAKEERRKLVIQGVVQRNTEKGLLLETSWLTGEVKKVTRRSGEGWETTWEPISESVIICLSGHPNAVYFKPGAVLGLEILPEGQGLVEGEMVLMARYRGEVK
jgi:hypothetical protein